MVWQMDFQFSSSIDVEESITFLKQQPTSSIGSKVGTTDKVPKGDVDIKTGKLKKKGTTKEEYETSVAEGWEGTKKGLKERFTFRRRYYPRGKSIRQRRHTRYRF